MKNPNRIISKDIWSFTRVSEQFARDIDSELLRSIMLSGWTHSDEVKRKISESSKNRIVSEETKAKLRKPKPKGFGKHSYVKVNQLTKNGDFIKTWDSITNAEKNLSIRGISKVLGGA